MSSMKTTTTPAFHFFPLRLTCLCLAALLVACAPTPPRVAAPRGPSAADAAFEALTRRYFDEVVPRAPVDATALGDHRFDDKVDEVSAEARTQTVTLERDLLGALRGLDPTRLSRAH